MNKARQDGLRLQELMTGQNPDMYLELQARLYTPHTLVAQGSRYPDIVVARCAFNDLTCTWSSSVCIATARRSHERALSTAEQAQCTAEAAWEVVRRAPRISATRTWEHCQARTRTTQARTRTTRYNRRTSRPHLRRSLCGTVGAGAVTHLRNLARTRQRRQEPST